MVRLATLLFRLMQKQRLIFHLAFINATTAGGNNASEAISVAVPGNPGAPWRTWYIPGATPLGQAQEVAVGIIARGPNHGSKPLKGPDDIKLELVCARAPRQGPHHPPDGGASNKGPPGYPRGIIKTYAFDGKDFIYEVEDDEKQEEEAEDDEYYNDGGSARGTDVDCPESSATVL